MRSHIRLALFGFAVAFTALIAACGSNSAPHNTARGPAQMAILSGDNQVAQVAAPSFPQPVEGQLYRAPDGTVAWRWTDALLPAKAEAGTTVTVKGAPITNAVVCWADVPGAPRLIPFSVCTNTDSGGKAAFSIRPDTLAGKAKGQIHWDSAGTPIVTDSVQETVRPDTASSTYWYVVPDHYGSTVDTVSAQAVTDRYGNAVPYRITGDSLVHVAGDTAGTIAARVLSFALPGPDSRFRYLAVRDSAGKQIGTVRYFIGATTLEAVVCGLSRPTC